MQAIELVVLEEERDLAAWKAEVCAETYFAAPAAPPPPSMGMVQVNVGGGRQPGPPPPPGGGGVRAPVIPSRVMITNGAQKKGFFGGLMGRG